jgi:hypothetical protein
LEVIDQLHVSATLPPGGLSGNSGEEFLLLLRMEPRSFSPWLVILLIILSQITYLLMGLKVPVSLEVYVSSIFCGLL